MHRICARWIAERKSLIDKYRQLVLLYPGNKEPIGMVEGFLIFAGTFPSS
ncbi:MAG: hypothetical protein U0T56_00035 [Ferruginibacter sp.]